MKSRYVRFLAAVTLATFGILPAAAQTQLVDLGLATGYAINNAGQVALSTGIYSNGTVTPLPVLSGTTTPATPYAINASGQVAGAGLFESGYGGCGVPIEYTEGTLINLLGWNLVCDGADPAGGPATSINSSGTIVGWYESLADSHGETTTFSYSNGALTVIDVPCGMSPTGVFTTALCAPGDNVYDNIPYAINDSGEVVGTITLLNSSFGPCAYLVNNGVWTCLGPGTAYALNASGQVTGSIIVENCGCGAVTPTYAFLYKSGTITNLGTLPGGKHSTGYAINTTGQIVGSSDFTGTSTTHAFFYNGVMDDLNRLISATDPLKPYVTLTSAVGINDSLLILANGVDSRTRLTHAYLYQASFLEVAPATLSFTQAVGGTSQAQSVTVTNTGTTAIPIGTPYVDGDFSLRLNTCGASLAPTDNCRLAVVFVPKAMGVFTGALTIPSAGANYSQVPLSGVGAIAASISASSSTATVGQPLTLTWAAASGSSCSARARSTNSTWTASKPPFLGTIPASGTQTLTETVSGTMNYFLECTAPGVPAVSVSTQVVWNWPPVTVSISASPTTITAGGTTTLTWTSSNATSCTATGGGPNDSWPGTKATNGNQTVTEAVALDAQSALSFAISCNSTASGLSATASASVTENPAPARSGGGGGGGALNPLSLAFLASLLASRRARMRIARP
jgi:probable HAF family extracellular repeat protein